MARRCACVTFLLLVTLTGYSVLSQETVKNPDTADLSNGSPGMTNEALEAQMRINDAADVISRMKDDPQAGELLENAKGLLVVPHFTKAALIFGGGRGGGLLLLRHGDAWSGPAFYRISGGSVGVQIGGARGSLVMVLTSDKAVQAFQSKSSSWSLNAGAGLTAVNYTSEARGAATLSDVVIWSDIKGLFGGAAVGATNIARDQRTNQEYYNDPDVTTQQILSGAVASSGSTSLRRTLRMRTRQVAPPVKTASPGQPSSLEAEAPVR